MFPRSKRLILCAAGLAVIALFCSSCSKSSSNHPTSLSTPNGSVIGNWWLDGPSINVVADTGRAHDIVNGDTFRIGPNGMEVLLGSYMQPGGAYDRFLKALGATYRLLVNTTSLAGFETSLVVDCSVAHGKPVGTLELKIDISGTLVGSRLEVTYLSRMFQSGKEQERDQLTFNLLPGSQVNADMTGTFELTDISVVADLGSPHPFQVGDLTSFAGSKVMRLLDIDFTANGLLGTSMGDYTVIEHFSNAFGGRAEALFMAVGRENTPSVGLRRYIVFDAIRVGDGVVGNLFQIDDHTQFEDIDSLELAMTVGSANKAVLLGARKTSPGKKLVTFITMLGDR